jgi:hypothetical protein
VLPTHVDNLAGRYAAFGLNVNIPLFNGHLFSARRQEADLRAQAASQKVRELENPTASKVGCRDGLAPQFPLRHDIQRQPVRSVPVPCSSQTGDPWR